MSAQAESLPLVAEACVSAPRPKLGLSQAKDLAAVFKALADPTRVQIVSLLLSAGEQGLCVCDIGANFPLGQPTISHHLKLLRDAGLLRASKKGLWVYYSVNRESVSRLGIALPASQPIQRSECLDDECNTTPDREGCS